MGGTAEASERAAAGRKAFGAFRTPLTRRGDNHVYEDVCGHTNTVVHDAPFDTAVNGWLIDDGRLACSAGRGPIGLLRSSGDRAAAGFLVHVYGDRESRRPASTSRDMRVKLTALSA